MRARGLILLAAVAGAAFAAGCVPDPRYDGAPLALRFHPRAGAVHRYVFEQVVTMRSDSGTPLPPQDVAMQVYLTQAVGEVGADGVPVTSTIDSASLRNSALPAQMLDALVGRVRGLQTVTVLDDRMRPVRHGIVTAPERDRERLAPFEQGARGLAFPLPEGAVRVGDSWTVAALLPTGQVAGMGEQLQTTTKLTLREVRVSGSDTIVVVAVESRLPTEPIPIDLGLGGAPASVRLTGTLTGDQEFSLSRGTVLRAGMSGGIRFEMTGGIAGDRTLGMTLDQRLTLRMLGDP